VVHLLRLPSLEFLPHFFFSLSPPSIFPDTRPSPFSYLNIILFFPLRGTPSFPFFSGRPKRKTNPLGRLSFPLFPETVPRISIDLFSDFYLVKRPLPKVPPVAARVDFFLPEIELF